MPAKNAKKTSRQPDTDLVGTDPDDLTPAQAIAREILGERADLLPSVERIAAAELPEQGVVDALTSFRDALTQPGDPNRDPRVAIAAAAATSR